MSCFDPMVQLLSTFVNFGFVVSLVGMPGFFSDQIASWFQSSPLCAAQSHFSSVSKH